MGKPGFGFEKIMGRRKSSGNAIEDMAVPPVQDSSPAQENRESSSSGFHVLSHEEAERRRESAALKKAAPDKKGGFGRFSAFGSNKTRQQSFEEESSSSKRYDHDHDTLAAANSYPLGTVNRVAAPIFL